jgi:hypothetical protein
MFYQQKSSKINFPYDGTIFENKLFAEISYFTINTKQYYDFQIIITPMKDKSVRTAIVTIKWIFAINNITGKGILKYELEDEYYVDIQTYDNEKQKTDELIIFSYNKFSTGFEFDGRVLPISNPLESLEQSKIDQVRSELLKMLKHKCG